MKFSYGYKTKANETRYGVVSASSRDAVYLELRKHGIKPFKVELAPGFVNRIAALGKRTLITTVLVLVALVSLFFALRAQRSAEEAVRTVEEASLVARQPMPRHQIYGDPALMEELERTDYATVFEHPGYRFLAHYAQPGVMPRFAADYDFNAVTNALRDIVSHLPDSGFPDPAALDMRVTSTVLKDKQREVVELERIVLSMRQELSRYLSRGLGTPIRYVKRLNERQMRESQIYETARRDLDGNSSVEKWSQVNESLRAIGLKTIPQPFTVPIGTDDELE